MKRTVCLLGCLCVALQGCFSLTDKEPLSAQTAAPTTAADSSSKKTTAKSKKKTEFPQTLGGLIQSDSWIIYQEKQEEEFKGNVSYESDVYRFRADYALSQRAQNTVTATGNVYLRKQDPDGTWYELYADKAVYNYKTGKGYALSTSGKPVRLRYHTAKDDLIQASAHKADFDTRLQTYQLTGHAVMTHTDPQGQINTLKADRISARQKEQYALLEGHGEVFNQQYRLWADRMEYNGALQQAVASGNRPLAQGSTENGTFAIIADEVTAQTDTRDINLVGNVQGWILSDQINSAEKKAAHQ